MTDGGVTNVTHSNIETGQHHRVSSPPPISMFRVAPSRLASVCLLQTLSDSTCSLSVDRDSEQDRCLSWSDCGVLTERLVVTSSSRFHHVSDTLQPCPYSLGSIRRSTDMSTSILERPQRVADLCRLIRTRTITAHMHIQEY